MLAVSIAETFFIVIISCITALLAYFSWTVIIPKLPFKLPPVLLCIMIGCTMRLVCKPLLETRSADSSFDSWVGYEVNDGYASSSSSSSSLVVALQETTDTSHILSPPPHLLSTDAATEKSRAVDANNDDWNKIHQNPDQKPENDDRQQHKDNNKKKKTKKISSNTNKGEELSSSSPTTTTPTPRSPPFNIHKKLHMYGEGVVRTISNPVIHVCLACVGILIGSHIDMKFLQQHTKSLLCLTGGSAVGAYLFTMAVGCVLWPIQLLPMIHLVASTAMERSSSEALATISDSKILSSSSSSPAVTYFVRSTIFAAAAMDVIAVVVFVLSLGVIEKGSSTAHLTILEIVLGTTFVAVTTLIILRFHLTIESRILQPVIRRWNLSDRPFSILKQQDRAAILVLSTLVVCNMITPGGELLLAAVACGMKISYDDEKMKSGSSPNSPGHSSATTIINGNVLKYDDDTGVESSSSSGAVVSLITSIEHHSVLIYSVLFSIIGLRLDAAQLIETLVDSPKIALLLFLGRLVGLTIGGIAGSILGGGGVSRAFMHLRGLSLVTRIAVSIILLQKMEDALVGASSIVHSAIGAVLIDMCLGPALLQWVLKRVTNQPQQHGTSSMMHSRSSSSSSARRDRHYLDVAGDDE